MMQNSKNFRTLPIIGLTGVTGSGKTTVAGMLAAYGGYAISADDLSHEAIRKGKPAYAEILATFGPEILAEDGEINRKKLGARVFAQREQLTRLEQIIHPRVCEETWEKLRDLNRCNKGYTFAVIDAPLLIEAKMHQQCDSVWVITAVSHVERIQVRDGLSVAEASRRAAGRRTDLAEFADIVLSNDGDIALLAEKVKEALAQTAAEMGFDLRRKTC